MTPGFAVIWEGPQHVSYLTTQSQWSKDAGDAHVFASWVGAKLRARDFRDKAEVVKAWLG